MTEEAEVSRARSIKMKKYPGQVVSLVKSGESNGFKWHILFYTIPSLGDLLPTTIYLAYVDVTGTKLDGILDTEVVNKLGVDLHCGCTFVGPAENAGYLLSAADVDRHHWFIGEDYCHGEDCQMSGPAWTAYSTSISPQKNTPETIEKHLIEETIPSLIKALLMVDIRHPVNGVVEED